MYFLNRNNFLINEGAKIPIKKKKFLNKYNMTIRIYDNEGNNIPHFHLKLDNKETVLHLTKTSYFIHSKNDKKDELNHRLNSSEIENLIKVLNTPIKKLNIKTKENLSENMYLYNYLCYIWNQRAGIPENKKISENSEVPDYTVDMPSR